MLCVLLFRHELFGFISYGYTHIVRFSNLLYSLLLLTCCFTFSHTFSIGLAPRVCTSTFFFLLFSLLMFVTFKPWFFAFYLLFTFKKKYFSFEYGLNMAKKKKLRGVCTCVANIWSRITTNKSYAQCAEIQFKFSVKQDEYMSGL